MFIDDESVESSRRQQTEPIGLDTCLKAFTKEEELGEDELYYCSKCKKHRLAAKKLEIWRLPPILVSLHYVVRLLLTEELNAFCSVKSQCVCEVVSWCVKQLVNHGNER